MNLVFHRMPGHPLAAASAVVHLGWRHEPLSLLGISHFLEHVHYLGSVRYPDIDKETARYGTEINGSTLAEATVFSFVSLRADFPHLLDVLLDMVYHPRFDEAAVERERQVVAGAINQESGYTPWEWVRLKVDGPIFGIDELRSLDTEETIGAIRLEDLKGWQHRYYHAGNSSLLIAGDLELEAIQEKLAEAGIPSGEGRPKIQRHEYKEQFHQEIQRDTQPELYIGFRFKPPLKNILPHELLSILLGNYSCSRLFKKLRRERPLAYMVESGIRLLSDAGRFGIYVGISKPGEEEEVGKALTELLRALKEEGPSEEDLSWAKLVYWLDFLQRASDPERLLNFWVERGTFDSAPLEPLSLKRELDGIDREQIRQLCKQLFLPEHCFAALISPSGAFEVAQWAETLAT